MLMRACVVHLRNVERDPVPKMVIKKDEYMRQKLAHKERKIYFFNIPGFFELPLYQYAHFRMFLPSVECRTGGKA